MDIFDWRRPLGSRQGGFPRKLLFDYPRRNFLTMIQLDSRDRYTIGWIAALPIERAAAMALLDPRHEAPADFEQHPSDTNSYSWGQMGKHYIVIASLPAGEPGTNSAATTASNLLSSLPQIRIGLLVGIGGGVPGRNQDPDIRLGDVVVGQPRGTTGGVVQYDLGSVNPGQNWQRKGALNKPPKVLLTALSSLQAEHFIAPSKVPGLLQNMLDTNPQMRETRYNAPAFFHQGFGNDRLFSSTYNHAGGSSCAECDPSGEIFRDPRKTTDPVIHYGTIASGNTLVKDASIRDKLAEMVGKECICFEMEAAGLMDLFPCLVIRGICDYADSHKNDRWQPYASATAAAFAKELLEYVPANQLQDTQRAIDALKSISENMENLQSVTADKEANVYMASTGVLDIDQKTVLARLEDGVAVGASFDSRAEEHNPLCLPDTRRELLKDISEWANDSRKEAIFWLNGMAGTGKSTVSRTLAQFFASKRYLGASFFFKRGEADRGDMAKFMSTIAADLVHRVPALAPRIKGVIDSDPTILRGSARNQFDKLIWGPLSTMPRDLQNPEPIVIIIDALDECEGEDDIKLLIQLFSRPVALQSKPLKIFVTSRPEQPVRLGFNDTKVKYDGLVLQEISKPTIERDIRAFLKHKLGRIRDKYHNDGQQIAEDWPGTSKIEKLVKMATPLFIFAATVCLFIADRRIGVPDKQLEKILSRRAEGHLSQLAKVYMPLLDNQITGLSANQQRDIILEFRTIVGSIVILASPLSTSALAHLLDIAKEDIASRLYVLHSVLSVPLSEEEPVRVLHLSFRDFLLDPTQRDKNPFWIDEKQTHQAVAVHCLRLMESLRQDICDVGRPGTPRSAVGQNKVETSLPSELRYACLYWAHHLQATQGFNDDCKQVLRFLKCHFLHWLESLSLMGRAWESVRIIAGMQSFSKTRGNGELSNFLDDAMRFILANISGIDDVPLQLYFSFLVFAPEKSEVRVIFEKQVRRWMSILPKVEGYWGPCVQTLEGHRDYVWSVAFSLDGTLVASGSLDRTVRLWRVNTGKCFQTLEGLAACVTSVAFSPDGALVALGLDNAIIQLWRVNTGECIQTLEGHSGWSVAFSPDGAYIAAGGARTVQLWHVKTGKCTQMLDDLRGEVWSVAFSPDGALVAAGFAETVQLWRANTGESTQTLDTRRGLVWSVAFSPDGALMASGSSDCTIWLWCLSTGKCIKTLVGHRGWVRSVAFSPDGALIVSGSKDNTVRLWRVSTGECTQKLDGHSKNVKSVAFSADGALVASGSEDKTVRLWRVNTSKRAQKPREHSNQVRSLAISADGRLATSGQHLRKLERKGDSVRSLSFSPDGALVASGSEDKTVRLWRVSTGECTQTLDGHSHDVCSVAFSPDGALVASGSSDETLRLWRVSTGKCIQILKTLDGYSGNVCSVAFSPDGALIASGYDDQIIRLWRVDSGECTQTIRAHGRHAFLGTFSVAFSADGVLVASVSDYKLMCDGHVNTGVRMLKNHSSPPCTSSSEFDSRLFTDHGSFVFDQDIRGQWGECRNTLTFIHSEYGISADGCWVTRNAENWLWLPPEYRDAVWATSGSAVALGYSPKRVITMKFCNGDSDVALGYSPRRVITMEYCNEDSDV
ncbi:hypothetical protein QQS21_012410 [Conoideocrella luteorostrata]|uniref:Nephrocystin 3-like N-terminal domain-containing protein n=1 Tax=Conoideocrella luteorostrata TaxID=1105319 RepID=A0AAJ0CFR5_9HYPO|nr:hypothetical protein QQS21_012410 [Conoideocrella luteorostrata]